jgi:hypothetical protein
MGQVRAKYGSDFGFQGRSMHTVTTEPPQLALASFLSESWEARYVARRHTALERTESLELVRSLYL